MQYNPKLDYLFCKYLIVSVTKNEQQFKHAFWGKTPPESINECKILFYKDLLDEIKNSADYIETLLSIHEKLYGFALSKGGISLLKRVFKYENEDLIYQRLAECSHDDNNADFIAFVYTAKRFAKNLNPIVFYKESTKDMFHLFRVGDTERAKTILKIMCKRTERQNHYHALTNREEIVGQIINKKNDIINLLFIKEIFLVGSCARDEMNEYSDVDLVCIVDKENTQKADYRFGKVRDYFSTLFNIHVDLKMGGDLDGLDLNDNFRRDLFRVF